MEIYRLVILWQCRPWKGKKGKGRNSWLHVKQENNKQSFWSDGYLIMLCQMGKPFLSFMEKSIMKIEH